MHCRYHGPIAGMAASQQLFLDASAHIKASDLIEVSACFLTCIPNQPCFGMVSCTLRTRAKPMIRMSADLYVTAAVHASMSLQRGSGSAIQLGAQSSVLRPTAESLSIEQWHGKCPRQQARHHIPLGMLFQKGCKAAVHATCGIDWFYHQATEACV